MPQENIIVLADRNLDNFEISSQTSSNLFIAEVLSTNEVLTIYSNVCVTGHIYVESLIVYGDLICCGSISATHLEVFGKLIVYSNVTIDENLCVEDDVIVSGQIIADNVAVFGEIHADYLDANKIYCDGNIVCSDEGTSLVTRIELVAKDVVCTGDIIFDYPDSDCNTPPIALKICMINSNNMQIGVH